MKIIITEEQFNLIQESDRDFNKTKKLVNSMYGEDKLTIDEIATYTGLDKDAVIVLLYDREIINDEEGECQDKYQHLYYTLWNSGLIDKIHKYEYGSVVDVNFDRMSGAIIFGYTAEGYRLTGYATLMWDAEPKLPIEYMDYFDLDDNEGFDISGEYSSEVKLNRDIKFNNIKTLRQLVDYFNNDYYTILKKELDPIITQCIKTYS